MSFAEVFRCWECTKQKPATKHCPYYDLCYDTFESDSLRPKIIKEEKE